MTLFQSSPMTPVELVTLRNSRLTFTLVPSGRPPLQPSGRGFEQSLGFSIYANEISPCWFIHASRPLESHGSQSLSPSKKVHPSQVRIYSNLINLRVDLQSSNWWKCGQVMPKHRCPKSALERAPPAPSASHLPFL